MGSGILGRVIIRLFQSDGGDVSIWVQRAVLVVAVFAASGCSAEDLPEPVDLPAFTSQLDGNITRMSGPIENRLLGTMILNVKRGQEVVLDSAGGVAGHALVGANILTDLDFRLTINTECMSACASYILPAAQSINFENQPIIGFHRDLYSQYLAYSSKHPDSGCFSEVLPLISRVHSQRGLNLRFNNLVSEKLGLLDYFSGDDAESCAPVMFANENLWYFPSTQTLKDIWGLSFSGEVCADSERCVMERIAPRVGGISNVVLDD